MDDWELRKDFMRLSSEDETVLKSLHPFMIQHVDELVEAFYLHLLSFSETRKLLSDELITNRLKHAQKQYLLSLVTGPYDHAYEEGRRRIGQVHERLRLTPQWYLGAYALQLTSLQSLLFEEFRNQPVQYRLAMAALTKVVFLDCELAIEAYIQKSSEQQEYATHQLATLTRELQRGLVRNKEELLQTQEQLRHTERLAEMGALAAGLAHEIGTPMNVILGRAEHLMRRTEDDTIRKGLETIAAQVERITKLMNQLLSFARRRPSERRPTDLRRLVQDCLYIVQDRLNDRGTEVVTEFEEALPSVHLDPDQMTQVLLNLLLNATQAMSERGTLRLTLEREGDHQVKVTVADSGHGIPPDILPRIFEPFFTTKESGKGTGLGLTVVKGIVQEHGGSIGVDSELGQGTTFTLLLPVSSFSTT